MRAEPVLTGQDVIELSPGTRRLIRQRIPETFGPSCWSPRFWTRFRTGRVKRVSLAQLREAASELPIVLEILRLPGVTQT